MTDMKSAFDSASEADSKAKTKSEAEANTAPAPTESTGLGLAQTLASASERAAETLAKAEAKAKVTKAKAEAAASKSESKRDDAKAKAEAKQADREAKAARFSLRWAKAKATAFALYDRASDDPYNFWTATVYAFATFVAMRSQAATAHALWLLSKPEAVAVAFVLEGFAIGFAGTRRNLRLKRQTGLLSAVSLVGQWSAVGLAAFINFYAHKDIITAEHPLYGYAMAATSIGAMLLFEIRTSAKIRTTLQNMERLPVPHPVFGLQYAIAFRDAYRWAKLASIASSAELTRGEAIARGAQMREAKAKSDLSNRLASEAKRAYSGLLKAAVKAKAEGRNETAASALEAAMIRLQDIARYGLESAAFEAAQMSASLVLKSEAEAMIQRGLGEAEDEIQELRQRIDWMIDNESADNAALEQALVEAKAEAARLEGELAETKAVLAAAPKLALGPGLSGPPRTPPSTPPPVRPSSPSPKAKAAVVESAWRADFGNNPDLEAWAMTHWSQRSQTIDLWSLRIAALAQAFPGEFGSRDGVVIPTMSSQDETYGLFWSNRGWAGQAMRDLRELREAGLPAPTIAPNSQSQIAD
jgi:hypothetical protein